MVRHPGTFSRWHGALSVLALSSRFDGPEKESPPIHNIMVFQYSLCRVVLMVAHGTESTADHPDFQYSLCRVVLMVTNAIYCPLVRINLSVLALSSRFDGPVPMHSGRAPISTFSTRSVESF